MSTIYHIKNITQAKYELTQKLGTVLNGLITPAPAIPPAPLSTDTSTV